MIQCTFWITNLFYIEYYTVAQRGQLDLFGPHKSNRTAQGQQEHTLLLLCTNLILGRYCSGESTRFISNSGRHLASGALYYLAVT